MKKQKILLSGIVAVLVSALFISSAPFILAQTGRTVTAGYGYGYGYGYGEEEEDDDVIACHAKRPKRLHAKKTANPDTIVRLSWKKVKFKDCEKKKPSRYIVKIYRKKHFVKKYSLVTKPAKQVRNSVLKRNRLYRFKVRAVAVDGAKTNWSKWKKFTTPNHY